MGKEEESGNNRKNITLTDMKKSEEKDIATEANLITHELLFGITIEQVRAIFDKIRKNKNAQRPN